MKKLLIFHPALAPYRVDQFNALSKLFDLEVVFIFDNVWNHKFDQSKLTSQLEFKFSYLLKGIRYKGRVFRFGMLKKIKRVKPDYIVGFEFSFTTQYLILLKRLGIIQQKIGSTIDDSIDICNNVQSRSRYIARKQTVTQLDFLIVLSNEVANYYQTTFNLSPNQLIVSPILQNPERLRKKSDELERIANRYTVDYQLKNKKILLFVGRFIPEKGLYEFVKNVQELLISRTDTLLVLVGDGDERKRVKEFAEENHLAEKVLLPGRFEGDELYAWYLCAGGFVLPSKYEPFGAVVNEALIFGLNVLCSKYAGASGLIGKNGLIFDPVDTNETKEQFEKFLNLLLPVESVHLADKPMLMGGNSEDLKKEWEKIYA